MSRKIIARLRIDDDTALDSIGCLSEKIGSISDISLTDAVASDKDGVIYAYLDYIADWAFKQAGRDEGDDFEVPMSFDDWADSAECPAEKKKFNPFYDSMFLISRDSNRVPKRFFVELYPDELIELWDARQQLGY